MTELHAFDHTLQTSREWLRDLQARLQCDPNAAYAALRAGLHVIRDHLPLNEAVDLAAQLPMLIRGMYFDGWRPNRKQRRARHLESYQQLVAEQLSPRGDLDPAAVLPAVMHVLSLHVSRGEVTDVMACLPREIQEIWA
jgi:uncharacterized protein (DUF2267 family)